MALRATKWQPVADIDSPFESISYAFRDDALSLQMHGTRTLVLGFSGVVALRFENECPGYDFTGGADLPMLRPSQTFPLLRIEGSPWLEQWALVWGVIFLRKRGLGCRGFR